MLTQRLQFRRFAYNIKTGVAVFSAPTDKQLLLRSLGILNGTGSSMDIAMGHSMNSYGAKAYTLQDTAVAAASATPTLFVDDTTGYGDANNNGFYISAKEPFSMVTFDVTQASTGSPVYEYTYWNGSSFTALTTKSLPTYNATGLTSLIFMPPYDWSATSTGVSNLESTWYTIRVRATTAPSQAVNVSSLKICKLIAYRESVEGNQSIELDLGNDALLLEQGESLIPYFATANAENVVELSYKISP